MPYLRLGVRVDFRDETWVIISMMVMVCVFGIATIRYDRRRSGLPSASLDMEYDNNNITE